MFIIGCRRLFALSIWLDGCCLLSIVCWMLNVGNNRFHSVCTVIKPQSVQLLFMPLNYSAYYILLQLIGRALVISHEKKCIITIFPSSGIWMVAHRSVFPCEPHLRCVASVFLVPWHCINIEHCINKTARISSIYFIQSRSLDPKCNLIHYRNISAPTTTQTVTMQTNSLINLYWKKKCEIYAPHAPFAVCTPFTQSENGTDEKKRKKKK